MQSGCIIHPDLSIRIFQPQRGNGNYFRTITSSIITNYINPAMWPRLLQIYIYKSYIVRRFFGTNLTNWNAIFLILVNNLRQYKSVLDHDRFKKVPEAQCVNGFLILMKLNLRCSTRQYVHSTRPHRRLCQSLSHIVISSFESPRI